MHDSTTPTEPISEPVPPSADAALATPPESASTGTDSKATRKPRRAAKSQQVAVQEAVADEAQGEQAKDTNRASKKAAKKTSKRTPAKGGKDAKAEPEAGSKAPKRRAPRKGAKAKDGAPTLRDLCRAYLTALDEEGRSVTTVASYGSDLGLLIRHFGEDADPTAITSKQMGGFFASDAVNLTRGGLPKSEISIKKHQRVARLALRWGVEAGLLKEAPLPE